MESQWMQINRAEDIANPEVREVMRALLAVPHGIADQRVLRRGAPQYGCEDGRVEAVVFLASYRFSSRAAVVVEGRAIWGTCSPLRPVADDPGAGEWWSVGEWEHYDSRGNVRDASGSLRARGVEGV